jgi:F plasmid transfer operon, TraF, protein
MKSHHFFVRASLVSLGAIMGGLAWANQSLVGAGYSMSTGYVTNPYNLHSANHNPAGLQFLIAPKSSIRIGYLLPNLSAQLEVGDATGMKDAIDRIDVLTKKTYTTQTEVDAAKAEINGLLPKLENGGQIALGANITPLATPFVWRNETLRGALSFNFDAELQLRAQFLSAPVVQTGSGSNLQLQTNSGLDVRAVLLQRYAFGYGGTPWAEWSDVASKWGGVDVGGRVSLLSASARRDYKLSSTDSSTNASDLPSATSSALGLDLGLMNTHESFQVGMTGYNLNTPSFKFADLSNSAAIAQQQAGKLSLSETAQMKAHWVLEGSWFSTQRSLTVQASHALNSTTNLVGEDKQYSTLSVGYYPKFDNSVANFFTPTLRAGLRKNQAGSKLTTTSVGLTLFRALNLDYWASPESTSFETGKTMPRTVGFSVGLTSSF